MAVERLRLSREMDPRAAGNIPASPGMWGSSGCSSGCPPGFWVPGQFPPWGHGWERLEASQKGGIGEKRDEPQENGNSLKALVGSDGVCSSSLPPPPVSFFFPPWERPSWDVIIKLIIKTSPSPERGSRLGENPRREEMMVEGKGGG